jgi:tRNA(adenine34) deaminase
LHNLEDIDFMRQALLLAEIAAGVGEIPVGALIVFENQVIATAYNEREGRPSAVAHAELSAIQAACARLGRWRLSGCTLYVTLEPCVMCAGAIVNARLDRVVFGATDSKAGAVTSLFQVLTDSRLNHRPQVTAGVLADNCGQCLKDFFRRRRTEQDS